MKLIFVYNADSGIVNNVIDIAHKIIKPETYACSLCQLTHGSFREKRLWTTFKNQSTVPLDFYHKDEFKKTFKSKFLTNFQYPIVLMAKKESLEIFMSTDEVNAFNNLEPFIETINNRLDQFYKDSIISCI